MPELDSHAPSPSNTEPLATRYSPWHACGPTSSYSTYSAGMRRNGDLHLLGTTLRLKPEETDTQAAAEQWEKTFGVRRTGAASRFTNATMNFIQGEKGQAEGIVDITIGVDGRRRLEEILWRAEFEGVNVNSHGCLDMLGIKWKFVLLDEHGAYNSKL
jgi:hypothetical protein